MKKILCIGLAFVLVGIFSMGAYAADSGLKAKIISTKGDVKVDPQGNGSWVAANVNMELNQGAIIKTGAGSSANLAFDTAMLNVLNVEENTTLSVDTLSEKLSEVGLSNGNILVILEGLKKGSTFQVKTPTAICGARGTKWYTVVFQAVTRVEVIQDSISFQPLPLPSGVLASPITVPAGWWSTIRSNENPTSLVALSTSALMALNAKVAGVEAIIVGIRTTITAQTQTTTETEQEAQQTANQQQVKLEGSGYTS